MVEIDRRLSGSWARRRRAPAHRRRHRRRGSDRSPAWDRRPGRARPAGSGSGSSRHRHRPVRRTAGKRSRSAGDWYPGLIDKDMGEALSQRVPLIVTVAQQVARGEVEVVEVELGARALMVAIAMQDQTRFLDQRRQNLGPQAQRGVTMPHQAIHNAVHDPNQERMAVPLAKLQISPMKIAWRCWRYAGYAYVRSEHHFPHNGAPAGRWWAA